MKFKTRLLVASVACAVAQISFADEGDIRWNGYLNMVGGILKDEPRADSSAEEQHPGYGLYEDNFTFDPQTSGALQATKVLDEKTMVTAQIYGEGSTDGYTAKLKWLYVTFNPDDNSTFRIGRIGTPIFYYSDFLNVGFAYHWITPPVEVYQYDTTMGGIDYTYRGVIGDTDWAAEAFVGQFDQFISSLSATTSARDLVGFALTTSTNGWLTLRAVTATTLGTLSVEGLTAEGAVDQAMADPTLQGYISLLGLSEDEIRAAALPDVAEKLDLEEFRAYYYGLFAKAELDNFLMIAEWSHTNLNNYLFNTFDAWHVSGGYRFGDTLVHITVAESKSDLSDDSISDSKVSAPTAFTEAGFGSYIASAIGAGAAGQVGKNLRSISLGARIDTSLNTALKFEITSFEEKESLPAEEAGIGKNLLFRTALNVSF